MSFVSAAMVAAGRVVGEPRLSPDAAWVAFNATTDGRAALVAVPASGGPELVLTTDPAPVSARPFGGGTFVWTPDGAGVVYAAVDGGVWLQLIDAGPPRRITVRHPEGSAGAPAVSPDGDRVAYVIDQHHVAVASLDPTGPSPARLSDGNDFAFDPAWSPDGSMVVWHEWNVPNMPWDASRIVAWVGGQRRVVAGGDGIAVAQPRFAADGQLGFLCDATGWLNLWVADADLGNSRPHLDEPTEHGDPAWGQGIRSWAWSPGGDRVVVRTNEDGFSRLLAVDPEKPELAEVLGRGVHGGLSWVGYRIAAVRSGARTPTEVVVYDSGERTAVARGPVAGWEALDLPEPEVVRWRSDDGAEIPGRLYRPPGVDRPPLLCWIHGGPTSQWMVTFNPRFAFFLERGWAILVPDHRGSTGHGRDFALAMHGRWGERDVDDCAAGMRTMADRGLVDGERMAPMGQSAGGFTTLLLLARHPELCAAGVALSAVADLLDLAERSHRFERHYTHTLVGPLPDSRSAHVDRSPIGLADRITAPLLLLHGSNDEAVPVGQAEALAATLRGHGADVDLHVYEGEGHGWGRSEVVVDELERIERFLDRHVRRLMA